MDISSPVRDSKSLKLGSESNSDEGGSKICRLPDTILHRILSFLPTKDAVRTSLLSKRWQLLWMSVAKLMFEEDANESASRTNFLNFIERVLLLHDTLNLQSFYLCCSVLSDGPRINAWINAAIRRNVQNLMLYFSSGGSDGSFVLPQCLFTCESIEKLELDTPLYYNLKVPYYISLPNLKILTLSCLTFVDHHSAQQLCSGGCPSLKNLSLMECIWANVKAIHVSSPMLEDLLIMEYKTDDLDPPGCQFIISGSRLKHFGYRGELKYDYCIIDTPALANAIIDVSESKVIKDQGRNRQAAYRTHKLLRGLTNSVENLTISYDSLDVLSFAEDLAAYLPFFDNLKKLDLFLEPMDMSCKGLMNILQKSPHLESLQFLEGFYLSARIEEDDMIFNPVPSSFLIGLKTVKIAHFNATEEDLRVVKSLLESAVVLEKLWLNCDEEKKIKILSAFPERSVNCKIAFY